MGNYQALVNVHGSVACKEKCGPSVSIALMRLGDKRNAERKTVSLTEDSNQFSFSNVIPGKYKLEVCAYFFITFDDPFNVPVSQ